MNLNELMNEMLHRGIKVYLAEERVHVHGKKHLLTPDILGPLKKHESEIISLLKRRSKPSSGNEDVIPNFPRNGRIPLSFNQERIWYLSQIDPESCVYNLPLFYRFSGPLETEVLERGIHEIIHRHEILRTSFPLVTSEPEQVISSDFILKIPIVNLQDLPEHERESTAEFLAREQWSVPFDLSQLPLFRIQLLRFAKEEHVFLFTIHHIIFDGWSGKVFAKELETLYQNVLLDHETPSPALPIQYSDYAHWQYQSFKENKLNDQISFWKNYLEKTTSALQFSSSDDQRTSPPWRGATCSFELSESLIQSLKEIHHQEEVTFFATLLTCFQILLFHHTGHEEIILCSPFANRFQKETENLIGFFNNLLPIRTRISKDSVFSQLLKDTHLNVMKVSKHQDLPFQKLAELPGISNTKLSSAMFVLREESIFPLNIPEISIKPFPIEIDTADFDLSLALVRNQQGIRGTFQFKTAIFSAEQINTMVKNFHRLLEYICRERHTPIQSLLQEFEENAIGIETFNPKHRIEVNSAKRKYLAPRNKLEIELVKIWEKSLNIKNIGIKDDYWKDLGGHSLHAMKLIAEIEEVFDRRLPLVTFFQAPTIEKFSEILSNDGWAAPWGSLVEIQPNGSKPPLFGIHGMQGYIFGFKFLVPYLDPDLPLFGIQPLGMEGIQKPLINIDDMAAHYIHEIRKLQSSGPYYLIGTSFGGIVAFEMARQLHGEGEIVGLLAMVDTAAPKTESQDKPALQSNQRLNIAEANKIAQRNYEPKIYPGQITLFLAGYEGRRNAILGRDLGWKKLVSGGVNIHELPGKHPGRDKLSMFREPHVKAFGNKLRQCLNDAHNQFNKIEKNS